MCIRDRNHAVPIIKRDIGLSKPLILIYSIFYLNSLHLCYDTVPKEKNTHCSRQTVEQIVRHAGNVQKLNPGYADLTGARHIGRVYQRTDVHNAAVDKDVYKRQVFSASAKIAFSSAFCSSL